MAVLLFFPALMITRESLPRPIPLPDREYVNRNTTQVTHQPKKSFVFCPAWKAPVDGFRWGILVLDIRLRMNSMQYFLQNCEKTDNFVRNKRTYFAQDGYNNQVIEWETF